MCNEYQPCPLCLRPMIPGSSINEHHLLPKCKGGKDTTTIHRICHRKIHSLFTENDLAKIYNTADKLLEHEEIQKFVKWVQKKDPEFYDGSVRSNSRKK